MFLKKLFVYDNESLFNILDEIKKYLNFNPIKVDANDLENKIFKTETDFLVISKKKKENFEYQLILEETPIRIEKLIQIINLKFLKYRFNSQSRINIGNYTLNLNSREIFKGKLFLKLTEREINLILYLYESNQAVKIEKLQKEVWSYGSELETHTVETHIYRLRKKIKDKFKDDNFISSTNSGYKINWKKKT